MLSCGTGRAPLAQSAAKHLWEYFREMVNHRRLFSGLLLKVHHLHTPQWSTSSSGQLPCNRGTVPQMAAAAFAEGPLIARGPDNASPRIWAPIPHRSVSEIARSDVVRTPSPAFESYSAVSSPARARSASQYSSVSLPEASSVSSSRILPGSRSAWSASMPAAASWKSAEDIWDQRGGSQGNNVFDGFSRSPRAPMSISSLSSSSSSMAVVNNQTNLMNESGLARGPAMNDASPLHQLSAVSHNGKDGSDSTNVWGSTQIRTPDGSNPTPGTQFCGSKGLHISEHLAQVVDRRDAVGLSRGEWTQQQFISNRDRASSSPRHRGLLQRGINGAAVEESFGSQDVMAASLQTAPRQWGPLPNHAPNANLLASSDGYFKTQKCDYSNGNAPVRGRAGENVLRGVRNSSMITTSTATDAVWYPSDETFGGLTRKDGGCAHISVYGDARDRENPSLTHLANGCVSPNSNESRSVAPLAIEAFSASTEKGLEVPWNQAMPVNAMPSAQALYSLGMERASQAADANHRTIFVHESLSGASTSMEANGPSQVALGNAPPRVAPHKEYAGSLPVVSSNGMHVLYSQLRASQMSTIGASGDSAIVGVATIPVTDSFQHAEEKSLMLSESARLATPTNANVSGISAAHKPRNSRRNRANPPNNPNCIRTGTSITCMPLGSAESSGAKVRPEPLALASIAPTSNLATTSPLGLPVIEIGTNGGIGDTANMAASGPFTPLSGRSLLLDRFRAALMISDDAFNTWQLTDIFGHVVEFSTDQHGSRFIQTRLETATAAEVESVLHEVLADLNRLITDVFGNYVVQKLLEHGTARDLQAIAAKLKNRILPLSLHMYGCRAVQKALEVFPADTQAELVAELDGHVLKCIRDQNGNHVVQKCIERVPGQYVQFIVDAVSGQAVSLAEHSYGCRVIQRILEYSPEEQKAPIMREIMQACRTLIRDQYGNYVIQHVVEHGKEEERGHILRLVRDQCVSMSQHKYASNVVERCLQYGSPDDREALIDILLGRSKTASGNGGVPLMDLVQDQFGNYVVQRVLDVANEEQRECAVQLLRVNIGVIKRYSYGKHIIARLENASFANTNREQNLHSTNHQAQLTCSKKTLPQRIPADISSGSTLDPSAHPNARGPSVRAAPSRTACGTAVNSLEQDSWHRSGSTNSSHSTSSHAFTTSTTERLVRPMGSGRTRRQSHAR
ncbi:Pumilio 2 [Cyanidiococcus yangmingshanensis]|uniref:Pumilio 2 n=1 Tax=Cyanidiococcus yangmingshanensis TaxID=2690220 RepID=A0A7J7IE07_9RHOD|nr:Pumilio 2 [Cyanidiococcus yangmingshanensis]